MELSLFCNGGTAVLPFHITGRLSIGCATWAQAMVGSPRMDAVWHCGEGRRLALDPAASLLWNLGTSLSVQEGLY